MVIAMLVSFDLRCIRASGRTVALPGELAVSCPAYQCGFQPFIGTVNPLALSNNLYSGCMRFVFALYAPCMYGDVDTLNVNGARGWKPSGNGLASSRRLT